MIAKIIILFLNLCLINANEHQSSVKKRLDNLEKLLADLNSNWKRNDDAISMEMKKIEIKVSVLSEMSTKNVLEIEDALKKQAYEINEKFQVQLKERVPTYLIL